MHNRTVQFSLRTMFLITTVVAVVTYTFTIGTGEGVLTLFFFACFFGSKTKKERWLVTIILVGCVVGLGISARHWAQSDTRLAIGGGTACVNILFTGHDQIKQSEVSAFLTSEMPQISCTSGRSTTLPFFRTGHIRLAFDSEKLADVEAEVRRKIAKKFPGLTVSIEGHSFENP